MSSFFNNILFDVSSSKIISNNNGLLLEFLTNTLVEIDLIFL